LFRRGCQAEVEVTFEEVFLCPRNWAHEQLIKLICTVKEQDRTEEGCRPRVVVGWGRNRVKAKEDVGCGELSLEKPEKSDALCTRMSQVNYETGKDIKDRVCSKKTCYTVLLGKWKVSCDYWRTCNLNPLEFRGS